MRFVNRRLIFAASAVVVLNAVLFGTNSAEASTGETCQGPADAELGYTYNPAAESPARVSYGVQAQFTIRNAGNYCSATGPDAISKAYILAGLRSSAPGNSSYVRVGYYAKEYADVGAIFQGNPIEVFALRLSDGSYCSGVSYPPVASAGSTIGGAAYYQQSDSSEHFIWNGADSYDTTRTCFHISVSAAFQAPTAKVQTFANSDVYSTAVIPGSSFQRADITSQSYQYDPSGYTFKTESYSAPQFSYNSPSPRWFRAHNSNTSTSFWFE